MSLVIDHVAPLLIWFASGALGWFVTHFVAKPVLEAYQLRRQVVHAVIIYANVSPDRTPTERINEAVAAYRDLAASAYALAKEPPSVSKWVLERVFDFDHSLASAGLFGLSNDFGKELDGSRAVHKHNIAKGLRLQTSYTDEQIQKIQDSPRRR